VCSTCTVALLYRFSLGPYKPGWNYVYGVAVFDRPAAKGQRQEKSDQEAVHLSKILRLVVIICTILANAFAMQIIVAVLHSVGTRCREATYVLSLNRVIAPWALFKEFFNRSQFFCVWPGLSGKPHA
jgi:hypothetical protein